MWDQLKSMELWPDSLTEVEGGLLALGRDQRLWVAGDIGGFQGEHVNGLLRCPLSAENAARLREKLPWTAPSSHRAHAISIGLGDRLGLASPGHLALLKARKSAVFPVLAQQSIRELNLTGRSYPEVLDTATWAVLQEGWRGGFGADGDHLKTFAEIQMALDCGISMLTLDCSEHIDNRAAAFGPAELEAAYAALPADVRAGFESRWLERDFVVGGFALAYPAADLKRIVLVYHKALAFMEEVHHRFLESLQGAVDFEISIDETATPTDPRAHFFLAEELKRRGVEWVSMAPRFCGHFEKGIDYMGDRVQFESEYAVHEAIARAGAYKLSIHSGSDKFSVFPIIGRLSPRFHLKTAGTNWLEAVRVIAKCEPTLFRELYAYAAAHIDEAKAYYVISYGPETVPPLDTLGDAALPSLLERDDARQTLHVAYGLLLQNPDFHDRIYAALERHAEAYRTRLIAHIGKHLDALGL